jgi:hypothetical protein
MEEKVCIANKVCTCDRSINQYESVVLVVVQLVDGDDDDDVVVVVVVAQYNSGVLYITSLLFLTAYQIVLYHWTEIYHIQQRSLAGVTALQSQVATDEGSFITPNLLQAIFVGTCDDGCCSACCRCRCCCHRRH